jgi:hypothetical protein
LLVIAASEAFARPSTTRFRFNMWNISFSSFIVLQARNELSHFDDFSFFFHFSYRCFPFVCCIVHGPVGTLFPNFLTSQIVTAPYCYLSGKQTEIFFLSPLQSQLQFYRWQTNQHQTLQQAQKMFQQLFLNGKTRNFKKKQQQKTFSSVDMNHFHRSIKRANHTIQSIRRKLDRIHRLAMARIS